MKLLYEIKKYCYVKNVIIIKIFFNILYILINELLVYFV